MRLCCVVFFNFIGKEFRIILLQLRVVIVFLVCNKDIIVVMVCIKYLLRKFVERVGSINNVFIIMNFIKVI